MENRLISNLFSIRLGVFFLTLFFLEAKCQVEVPPIDNKNNLAVQWAQTTLNFIQEQQFKSPTFVSRSLGYIGLTMYESVVHSSNKYQSIANQLNGLQDLPLPQKEKRYDWEVVLNASQLKIIELIWQPRLSMSWYTFEKIDKFSKEVLKKRVLAVKDTATINRSIHYGESLAMAIFNWSIIDGGHAMNFNLFDPNFKYPNDSKNGYWTHPVGGQSIIPYPLHPCWGENRRFVQKNYLPIAKIIPFSIDSTSVYYKQFKEVYQIQKQLTQEQKEIALWWGDDPSKTTTPPGHSYYIAITLAKTKKINLVTSAMLFARVGMACADAFVHCWKIKYTYFSERPKNYIRNNIDPDFVQFWPEPPFPSFPSGHSIQISAAAEVIIDILGNNISFIDDIHEGKPKDVAKGVEYKKRYYTAVSQIADECGISRLYGGIHTRQDNEIGLSEGKKIGHNINQLKWSK